MNRENQIEEILEKLENSGSKINYLKELRNRSLQITKRDVDLDEALGSIAKSIKVETEIFLNRKNNYGTNFISGISSCIYLPDFCENGEYKLKIFGGKITRSKSSKVNEKTLFDVAAITKLYTLVLLFKLEELGLIDLDAKISDINSDFQNLGDFTLNDLIRLHGELRTNGDIAQAQTQEEAYEILKTLYFVSDSRKENKYTDFGAIVISDTIEKVISNRLERKLTFEEIMYEYLLSPLNLYQTQFKPFVYNVSGNGNKKRLVHDPKAAILGGAVGNAGLFVNSDDLAKFSKTLLRGKFYKHSTLNKTHVDRLGEITFPNSVQSNKGNLGIYVKHPEGWAKTFTPPEFSTGSFSHQGWTGSVATFDPNNLIHNNILVNAIYKDENKEKVLNDKPVGFAIAFEEYQKQITKDIMLMYVVKQYYNRYCNVRENIDVVKYL